MSGLCGLIRFDGQPVDTPVLHKMAGVAAYRGPDGIHFWTGGCAGLSHLVMHTLPGQERERLPLATQDGTVLVADARIDNREELIHSLTFQGYIQHHNPTDAGLLMAAYLCWGEACVQKILGDFAVAVWDERSSQIFCFRDHLGIKPFFYSWDGTTFTFGSEIKQVLANPDVPRRLDQTAVVEYLAPAYHSNTGRTMFSAVKALLPGNSLKIQDRELSTYQYWDLESVEELNYKDETDYKDHFLSLLSLAVRDRLLSRHLPVGLMMSGGLDSTSIAALGMQGGIKPEARNNLVAYSYVFDSIQECDERKYIQEVEGHLGIKVHLFTADEYVPFEDLETYFSRDDSPYQSWQSLEASIFRTIRAKGGNVILNGNGADSLLEGTGYSYFDRLLGGDYRIISELLEHARSFDQPYFALIRRFLMSPIRWMATGFLKENFDGLAILSRRKRLNLLPDWIERDFVYQTGLSDQSRTRPDWNHLAKWQLKISLQEQGSFHDALAQFHNFAAEYGIEFRYPFMDKRLAEFIYAIPPRLLYKAGVRKQILRDAMTGLLPEEVRLRKEKARYTKFAELGVRNRNKKLFWELIKEPLLGTIGVVNKAKLNAAYETYIGTNGDNAIHSLWIIDCPWLVFTLELWLRHATEDLGLAI